VEALGLSKPDDHPNKWGYPAHTFVKHQILDKYLRTWISKLGSTNERLGYIDGFAGRGYYEDGSPGSPILAMRAAQAQHEKIGKLQTFLCKFIEINDKNYKSLEKLIEEESRKCTVAKCELHNSSFESVVSAFLDELEGLRPIPIFYFIDPFGWDGVPFPIIQRILATPRSEIFFTFIIGDMLRFLSSEKHHPSLTRLFGDESWKESLELDNEERESFLVNLYGKKIHNYTEASFYLPYRLADAEQRRTKYYLLFATHHIDGFMLMKENMKRAGSGRFGFLGPDEEIFKRQRRLEVVEDAIYANFLCRYLKGRSITFSNLCKELYPLLDTPVGDCIERDFRRVLKNLGKNGDPKIRIDRVTSTTSRGLQKDDVITFQ